MIWATLTLTYSFGKDIEKHQCSAIHPVARRTSMKQSFKKISFNESISFQPVKRASDMTADEKSQVYYSKDELKEFQLECKNICNSAITKARYLSNPDMPPAKALCFILETDTSLRGFEVQVSPERKRNKAMVNKAVHAYCKQLGTLALSPQQREIVLADAYSKLSYFSQMLAIMIARKDAAQVYEEDNNLFTRLTTTSPAPSTSLQTISIPNIVSPVNVNKKRVLKLCADDLHEKRCKLC